MLQSETQAYQDRTEPGKGDLHVHYLVCNDNIHSPFQRSNVVKQFVG